MMVKKTIALFIIGLAAIQTGFAAYIFYLMEIEGYAVLRAPVEWVRHFELFGSFMIAAAITGLLIGYLYGRWNYDR